MDFHTQRRAAILPRAGWTAGLHVLRHRDVAVGHFRRHSACGNDDRESPTLASTGKTAISPAPGGGYIIDSFFDVFTELSMDNGNTWLASTSAPPRMRFTGTESSNVLPPKDANYVSPAAWHAAYAQGIYLTNASHLGFTASYPLPAPGARLISTV